MTSSSSTMRRGAITPVSALILLLSFSVSGLCFWKAVPEAALPTAEVPSLSIPAEVEASASIVSQKAIQDVQVGDRACGSNPIEELDTSLGLDVEAATWKKLTLRAPKADGSHADVVLLRPDWWVRERAAAAGGMVFIAVPECGIDGNATVLSVSDCPPIAAGVGSVVTGTFRHSSASIIDVTVSGPSAPIGTTANHPFWGEDRQDFVRADSLLPGE